MNSINHFGVLRNILLLLTLVGAITGCGRTLKTEKSRNSLMDVDRQFSKLSVEKGVPIAFDTFMADSAVMYRQNGLPMKGRETIKDILSKRSGGSLQWEPISSDISTSGDLGYTLGEYEYTFTDSTGQKLSSFGNYVTIWRKQADGSWKFVFDAGNSAPPPSEKQAKPIPSFEKPRENIRRYT